MKIDILTLFPDMFNGVLEESIIKRAIDDKKVKINTINFRNFAKNKHKKVDDTPFGGGSGMVLMCQPIFDAVESVKKKNSKVILLSPQGVPYTQKKAYELSKEKHLILICGHYEGFDERIRTICDEEISIGDYVLTGGEVPAMVITDSVTRLLPGVIEEESHQLDSFNDNLLDYPTYTKPRNYKGLQVPDVLLSGNHARIEKWRKDKRLEVTKEKRPDLLEKEKTSKKEGLKDKKETVKKPTKKDKKLSSEIEIENKPINKRTCKYILVKTEKINAITIFNPKLVIGYRLKGKKDSKNKNRIVIVKDSFIKKVAMRNLKKKVDILTYRFNLVLSDPNDDEGTSRVLGEAEMLKQMIFSMYLKYLGQDNVDKIIKRINFLVNEFIRAKTLQNTIAPSIEDNKRKM